MILLSYGGGKDSTCLVAMDAARDESARWLGISRDQLDAALPPFDKAVFSDPGAEFAVTYDTVSGVEQLLGGRFVRIARAGETIAEWCARLGIIPLMPGGSHICSRKFKGDVLAAWAKKHCDEPPTWLIGIEADEGRRVKRFQAPASDKAEYRYPLVELGLNRERIDALLQHLGWPGVHKSSCVFCPFMSEPEIRDTYLNHPDDWQRVVEIEDAFQAASRVKHQRWLDEGQPLNRGGRAPRGMWRKDSWASGARLFAKKIDGKQLTVREWAEHIDRDTP